MPGGMFVYSPSVQVLIATANARIIDVSDDLTDGSMTLRENAPHSFQFGIANAQRKYDRVFTPNDRIVVYLKRIKKLLCFSGYLNSVPYVTAFQRTVRLTATCTMKRLLYHWWDPGIQAAQDLMANIYNAQDLDQSLSQKVKALLTDVVGWEPNKIHIGMIPGNWFTRVADLYASIQGRIDAAQNMVGGAPSIGGQDAYGDGSQMPPAGAPNPGGALPNTFGKCSWFGGPNDSGTRGGSFHPSGWSADNPPTPWYSAMRWPYSAQIDTYGHTGPPPGMTPAQVNAAYNWWGKGNNGQPQQILVINPKSPSRGVILATADWGPNVSTGRVIDLSPAAMQALGVTTDDDVHIAFAPAGAPLGPYAAGGAAATPDQSKALKSHGEWTAADAAAAHQSPSTAASPALAGAAAAVNFALKQVGKSYVSGGTGPDTYDCSGLMLKAWAAAGVTLPRRSQEQYGATQRIAQAMLQPGDLVFYEGVPPGHVAMVISGEQMVEAPHTAKFPGDPGGVVRVTAIRTQDLAAFGRVVNAPASVGDPTQGTAQAGAGAGAGALSNPLLAVANWSGPQADPLSNKLAGPKALMNDTQIMPTIQMMVQAAMRSFCSAPNGDFIAWFPDYFGVYEMAAKIVVSPIELQDFTITWSDENLVTHQFTAGTNVADISQGIPGGQVGETEMLGSKGIASVEFPEIMDALFNLQGGVGPFGDKDAILNRFGARPDFKPMQNIQSGNAEFWYALKLFQENWAKQFSSLIPMTFMPELWPGMLMQIPEFQLQVYIEEVNHQFSFASGGGFSTTASITSPSVISDIKGHRGLYGLPTGGRLG